MKKMMCGLIIAVLLALGIVQQRITLITEGYRVEALRHQREEFLDQHQVLQYNVLTLRSPAVLHLRLARRDIQLIPPQQVEVLRSSLRANLKIQQGISSPGLLHQAGKFAARWFDNGQQAEAEPAL